MSPDRRRLRVGAGARSPTVRRSLELVELSWNNKGSMLTAEAA
ncbi:hypothetical protein [Streptomyces sp. NPDC060035]